MSTNRYRNRLFVPIDWETAEGFISNYETQNNGERTLPTSFNHPTPPLLSIELDLAAMISLTDISSVSRVFFMIGHRDLEISNETRAGYTIVAMGVDSEDALMTGEGDFFWDALLPSGINPINNIGYQNVCTIVKDYRENHVLPTEFEGEDVMKGHSFPSDEIASIVRQENVAKLELILGYHNVIDPYSDQVGYTWILVGKDHFGNRMTGEGQVFDFCDPCPKKCPKNIDFIYF